MYEPSGTTVHTICSSEHELTRLVSANNHSAMNSRPTNTSHIGSDYVARLGIKPLDADLVLLQNTLSPFGTFRNHDLLALI